jgi:glycosyltransferase involved in cell wall biosynthesis
MPDRPLSVAYVISSTAVGGAERQVYELASTMRSRGWGVGVVSMLPIHEQFAPLEEAGVRLASLEMAKGVPNPRAVVRLARILRSWRPHVVHGHMVHGILITRLTRVLAPSPRVISTMHNQEQGPRWRYIAYRLTDPLADVTTTVSRLALDETVRRHAVRRKDILLVPNGIRTEHYERDPELRERTRVSLGLGSRFTWLTVGRLADAKRHTDLLASIRMLREVAPDVRLLIAGIGPLHSALQAEIEEARLTANVTLLGLREDVRALMQAADGFVMSSAWEGLPMVLLEASASSLPIVATDVGGSQDVIAEGLTGFLSPPREPLALAKAMLRVMAFSQDERQAMGERAQQHVSEEFDVERIADRWEGLYRGE